MKQGERAVQVARRILETSQQGIHEEGLEPQDHSSHMLLPSGPYSPTLTSLYPDKQTNIRFVQLAKRLEAIEKDTADLVVLPYAWLSNIRLVHPDSKKV